jgi:hypothetical protein
MLFTLMYSLKKINLLQLQQLITCDTFIIFVKTFNTIHRMHMACKRQANNS